MDQAFSPTTSSSQDRARHHHHAPLFPHISSSGAGVKKQTGAQHGTGPRRLMPVEFRTQMSNAETDAREKEETYVHVGILRCVGRGDGVRARRHTIKLEVGRVRLGDDVDGTRRVLVLMFVRRRCCLDDCGAASGGCRGGVGERGALEGGVGGVECAPAERLREGAGVLLGCYTKCGHRHGHGYCRYCWQVGWLWMLGGKQAGVGWLIISELA